MSIGNIVTKLGAPQYIVSHGFGFTNLNVIVGVEPISLSFTLQGTPISIPGNSVVAAPIILDFDLLGTAITPPPPLVINGGPIKLNIKVTGLPQVKNPTRVFVDPISLQIVLQGVPRIVAGTRVESQPIRLNFGLTGNTFGPDIFILDFGAKFNFTPEIKTTINTQLNFLAPVELEEEVMRVRIT